jgi:hypothetical protein
VKLIVLIVIFLTAALIPAGTSAAPNAEIAKRCMHYSCLVHLYKRPGIGMRKWRPAVVFQGLHCEKRRRTCAGFAETLTRRCCAWL